VLKSQSAEVIGVTLQGIFDGGQIWIFF